MSVHFPCITRKWRTRWVMSFGALVLVIITNPMGVAAQPAADLFVSSAFAPAAASAPPLGSAQRFAVLGGSTVTNTGPTTITGDVGVSPGTAVTGFPPGIVAGGAIHAADAVAIQGQNDVVTAYNALASQACTFNLTGQNLGGMTLVPGTYCFPSTSAQLTGTLTLDAQGNSNSVFIFQVGSTLTTASNSTVREINGGNHCNAFWQIGSSATLGTGTTFVGNILALTSIALNTSTSVSGRALARNGAVTLDTNTISFAACGQPAATPVPATATATAVASTATATAVPATATATAVPATATATAVPATTTPTVGASLPTATSAPAPSSGGGGGHSSVATSVPEASAPAPSSGGGGGAAGSGAAAAPPAAVSAPAPQEASTPGSSAGPAAPEAAPARAAASPPEAPATPAAPQALAGPAAPTAPEVPAPVTPEASLAPGAPEDSIQRLIPTPSSEDVFAPPAVPSSLPNTGDPFGSAIVWLTWAGAAAVLIGLSLLLGVSLARRR